MSDNEIMRQVEQAIWQGQPTELMTLPQIDPMTWAGSVQLDCRSNGIHGLLPYPHSAGVANHSVAVVMMVKDEADIISLNLSWLWFIGVRKMIIADNKSTDGTRDLISAFEASHPEVELLLVVDPMISYVQSLKTTGLMRYAMSIWPNLEWVFPTDADEFLIPTRGLSVLDSVPNHIDAVTVPKTNHYELRTPMAGSDQPSSPLARMPLRGPIFGTPPKTACRANLGLTVLAGNHGVAKVHGGAPTYQGAFALGLYYREFPTRGFEHFLRKVNNGGRAILAAKNEGRAEGGQHWLHWYDLLQAGGEPALLAHYEQSCRREAIAPYVHDPFEAFTNGQPALSEGIYPGRLATP